MARYVVSVLLTVGGLGITWLLASVTRAVAPELASEKRIDVA